MNGFLLCRQFCDITKKATFAGGRINLFRTIFSKEELGVVQFQQLRKKEQNEFKNNEEVTAYKQKVIQDFDEMFLCDKRDSLKKIIYLMDGDTEEITSLKSFLVKYHHDYHNTIHHVNQYCFGAGIMRMLYLHNLPDVAMQFFDDPDLKSIFEQQQTYKVFLDLLLENERYAEVLEYYKEIRRRLDLYGQYPDPTINLLGFAACYHLNTPDSFQYALSIWKKIQNFNNMNRIKYFLAALALKQSHPQLVLDLVTEKKTYVVARFLLLSAHIQLCDFPAAFTILWQTIDMSRRNENRPKPAMGQEMLQALQKALEVSDDKEKLVEFQRILNELKAENLITNETLHKHLCAPFPPMLPKNAFRKMKSKFAYVNK